MTTGTETARAAADLSAYVETLSASEALGEFRDLSAFYVMTSTVAVGLGTPGAVCLLSEILTPVLLDLARRIDIVVSPDGGGISAAPPRGVDVIKGRDLIARVLDAQMRDRGSSS